MGTPTWPPFLCLGTSTWPPWRHVKTLCSETSTHAKPKVWTFYLLTVYLPRYSVQSPITQWQLKPIWNAPYLLFQTVTKFIDRVLGFGNQFTDHVLDLVSVMIPFLENWSPSLIVSFASTCVQKCLLSDACSMLIYTSLSVPWSQSVNLLFVTSCLSLRVRVNIVVYFSLRSTLHGLSVILASSDGEFNKK